MVLEHDKSKTIETALDLLRSLKPSIAVLLQGRDSLKVKLNSLDILKPDANRQNAHVLFCDPSTDGEDGERFAAFCGKYTLSSPTRTYGNLTPDLINKAFINAGFITDKRPLKARHRSLITYG